MKIDVKESTMVRPIEPMARTCLWLSNLDALYSPGQYVPTCYFYGSNSADNFFDSTLLKAALGRALVLFYPMAGRLKMDDNNRIEVDCNGEGALFVEAVADGAIDDLGDLINTSPDLIGFTPPVGFSQGISACPVFLVQVTRFRCGGVCLGIAFQHLLADGNSALQFINSWSDIARGRNDDIIPPFFDRKAVLFARNPPQPKFTHIEYQTPPKMGISPHNGATTSSGTLIWKKIRLTRDQMNALKAKCKEEEGNVVRYSTFEVLAGHVWRCATMAWQLPKDQETKLHVAIDGRSRLQQPALPHGYFGNVVFHATPVALAGELYLNPIRFAANQVHEAIARMDNEYLRSAIDYLELLQPDLTTVSTNLFDYKCPNVMVISWVRLPFYDADFGWGRPIYVGRGGIPPGGRSHILPTNDGSILFGISFPKEIMELFEKLCYDI